MALKLVKSKSNAEVLGVVTPHSEYKSGIWSQNTPLIGWDQTMD